MSRLRLVPACLVTMALIGACSGGQMDGDGSGGEASDEGAGASGGSADGGTGGTADGGTGGTSDGGTGGTPDGGSGGTADGGTGGTDGGIGGFPEDSLGGTYGIGTGGTSDGGTGGTADGGTGGMGGGTGVECFVPSDCPGEDTECRTRTCGLDSLCGFDFAGPGTPLSQQTAGDCEVSQCDGVGEIEVVPADDPPSDDNECSIDSCDGTTPDFPPEEIDTPCNQDGGAFCDGEGACVECNDDLQCSVGVCIDSLCQDPTCGDDVQGGTETDVDCGGDLCQPCDNGQSCSDGSDCASSSCTDGYCMGEISSVRVVRVGDGSASLNSTSAPVFIDEFSINDGSLLSTVPLPVDGDAAFTLAGTGASEGQLSRSVNGNYLTLAGYAVPPGVPVVLAEADVVNRAVARIDQAGSVDTTTRLEAFGGDSVRSATSIDGSAFWVSGGTASDDGGIWFTPFGTVGVGTQVLSSDHDARVSRIFFGQLYASAGSHPTQVFAVGTGVPTTAGQTPVWLPGMPDTGASPHSFVLFDRNAGVPGVDTLYVADDRQQFAGGGIQKWTFDGATWTLVTTYGAEAGLTAACRGLTGMVVSYDVVLFATTTEEGRNRLFIVIDNGMSPAPSGVVARAPVNTVFRGVALSPHAP